jgi:hypothetical protein
MIKLFIGLCIGFYFGFALAALLSANKENRK